MFMLLAVQRLKWSDLSVPGAHAMLLEPGKGPGGLEMLQVQWSCSTSPAPKLVFEVLNPERKPIWQEVLREEMQGPAVL